MLEAIGNRLGQGEPLTVICRDIGICDDTVRNWMAGDDDVSRAIARAREDGEQSISSRLRATARGNGDSTGDVQRDKLIIDTDLKLLAKWNPKKWGDKSTSELTIKRSSTELGDDELAAIAASGSR
jgi:hypothetical protein